MIINALKKSIPQTIKSNMKLINVKFDYKKTLDQLRDYNSSPRFIIFGTPIHGNIGDHLIAESIIDYLRNVSNTTSIIEIPLDLYCINKANVVGCIHQNDLVLICGGGWLGSLWPHEDAIFQEIIRNVSQNHVIVFPQTVFYDYRNDNATRIIKSAKENYAIHQKLLLTLREEASYNFAINELGFHKDNTMLLPDMALIYDYYKKPNIGSKYDIIFCLRNDREKLISDVEYRTLQRIKLDYKTYRTDTVLKKPINPHIRTRIIQEKINEFQKARLIITDRLHGMLLAVIGGVPCIAINNRTSKVANTYYTWIKDRVPNVILTEISNAKFEQEVKRLIGARHSNIELQSFKKYFDDLTKILTCLLEGENKHE